MPFLPLDHPEPFAAVLGIMLYPKLNEQDQARAFAAQYLAEPIRLLEEQGRYLSYPSLLQIAKDSGVPLRDLDKRWYNGTMTGQTFKIFFALSNTKPDCASWENAGRIIEVHAGLNKVSGSRASIMKAKSDFHTVAHLWAAYEIRRENEFFRGFQRPFRGDPEISYRDIDDFQSFLAEAEILRKWGRTWQRKAAKSEPPLPKDAWRVPDGWQPLERQPGWPLTGVIPDISVDQADLDRLHQSARPPRRPRKSPKNNLSKIFWTGV